ncbi:ATP-binding protein [Motiliproteus sediminis]|uniref:ATP-binding protein n=1 Tax=Motiliproteus sediminis TaxID=1468178 RepID=UPI001AF01439
MHAYLEYRDLKSGLVKRLEQVEPLVHQSMAAALWYLDIDQIERLVHGIVDHQEVLGVRVVNDQGEVVVQHGEVPAGEELPVSDLAARLDGLNDVKPVTGLFSYHFTLEAESVGSQNKDYPALGEMWLYSHNTIVLDRVQQLFSWIFLAAVLKTVALWLIVSYFGRRLLARPLARLLDKLHGLPVGASEVPELAVVDPDADEIRQLDMALDGMGKKLHQTLGELQQANDQLQQSNWQLQRAIDQSPASVTIFSVDGRVEYTNPAFTQITGFSAAEAQEAFDCHLHQQQPLSEIMRGYVDGRTTEDRVYVEVENRRKDGRTYWLGVILSPVRNSDGEITHFLSSGTDISARKQAQAALQRKTIEQQETIAKLEEAHNQLLQSEKMASIGQLAAGVAHEINNPIGYVNSNLGSLRHYISDLYQLIEGYRGVLTDSQREALAELERKIDFDFVRDDLASLIAENEQGLERVKQIIKDLKDFSHVDRAEWVRGDLLKGLDSTLNVVWNELKYKAEVVKEYTRLPQIECMPSQLNQVFMNLLVNAAHAIEGQGVITIRTGIDGERVWVEVADTGKGIPAEYLPRLFEPFFTTKPVGKGTGLGLSVSYGIVAKHHGEITVDSVVGEGTRFRVWLPIRQPEGAA